MLGNYDMYTNVWRKEKVEREGEKGREKEGKEDNKEEGKEGGESKSGSMLHDRGETLHK